MAKIKFVLKNSGTSYRFNEFPVVIGRTNQCDLLLGGCGISKKHARLERHIDGYYLYDMKSLNGILVNGNIVTKAKIKNGDELQFGSSKVIFYQLEQFPHKNVLPEGTEQKKRGMTLKALLDSTDYLPPISVKNSPLEMAQIEPPESMSTNISTNTNTSDNSDDSNMPTTNEVTSIDPLQEHKTEFDPFDSQYLKNKSLAVEATDRNISPAKQVEDQITVKGEKSFRHLVLDIVATTRHELFILTQTLDRSIYDTDQFRAAVFSLARRHPHTKVKIMISNTESATKSRHKLIELYRRLPSNIAIRKISPQYMENTTDSYIISDNQKLFYRTSENEHNGIMEYLPSRALLAKSGEFNYLWDKSIEAVELRELHI